MTTSTREYDPADISSMDFWSTTAAERERTFAELRRDRPLSWQRPVKGLLLEDPDDPGYWAAVTHDDVQQVSRNEGVFVSGEGVMFESIPRQFLEASQSFLAMDDPRHNYLRKLVSAAFTPRRIATIEAQITTAAKEIISGFAANGSAEFVSECAAILPARMVTDMFGIPEDKVPTILESVEVMTGGADPAILAGREPLEALAMAQFMVHGVAAELAAERRENPGDDLITALVQAEAGGERLTDAEIAAFFVLLTVAGTDTTRQTTSHAVMALSEFPDQRDWLPADLDGRMNSAVEEFVRWATPVMTFRRTAVVDTELHGRMIKAGEKVVMFYPSANRDEKAFDHPERLDLGRHPNPHVGFGGGGVHFCMGSQLAKAQLRAIFRELLSRLPDIEAGAPKLIAGNFIHGVKTLPVTFTPEK